MKHLASLQKRFAAELLFVKQRVVPLQQTGARAKMSFSARLELPFPGARMIETLLATRSFIALVAFSASLITSQANFKNVGNVKLPTTALTDRIFDRLVVFLRDVPGRHPRHALRASISRVQKRRTSRGMGLRTQPSE